MSKITYLEIENIKKIKTVKVKPKDNLTIIEGRNGQGKTSILDSIEMALCGLSAIPQEPIRKGEGEGKIILDTEELRITRKFKTGKQSTLVVESKDGLKYSSPQAKLDELTGTIAFDPLEFSNMEPKKRVELIKKITGLDFSDLEKNKKETYEKRAEINLKIKNTKGFLDGLKIEGELGDIASIEIKLKDAEKKREELKKTQNEIREIEKEEEKLTFLLSESMNRTKELATQVGDLKERVEKAEKDLAEQSKKTVTLKDQLENIWAKKVGPNSTNEDLNKIEEELENLRKEKIENAVNRDKIEQRDKLKNEILENSKKSEELTEELSKIEEEKIKRITLTPMPIDGLEVLESDVYYDGISFSELCTSEQIKVSMAIAIAENPKLKFCRILNGSLLDDRAMQEIDEIAKTKDFQIFIERVSSKKTAQGTIYIEDGEEANE